MSAKTTKEDDEPPTVPNRRTLQAESQLMRTNSITNLPHAFETNSRPWVRWWWLRGPFLEEDIKGQLQWLRENKFGGVEVAWLCPLWAGLDSETAQLPVWLGDEFMELLRITKKYCDKFGLGCDFTFGSCWPFGGALVKAKDASKTFDGLGEERVVSSWEVSQPCYIVDHLSSRALRNYADTMTPAFEGGLKGSTSALFCDSWEITKNRLWTESLWDAFKQRYGYDLRHVLDRIEEPHIRYDHRKIVGETVVREFYETFTEICHELGARSRVQCHGSPTDLISAYASVDIPETEAILYNPQFSRIPASAAALACKPVVSCETFTCLYGFPAHMMHKEQVADLKLLADGLFAQGVNQIIWHGMPYNPPSEVDRCEFYASVHVGPNSAFKHHLPAFNKYLARISEVLKRGQTLSMLAVYLPNEDEIIRGELAPQDRVPGSQDYWEMRHVCPPSETEGYAPLWISGPFLSRAEVRNGKLCCGNQCFEALYVDVEWLDHDALETMAGLAQKGLPIVLKRDPKQPGHIPREGYEAVLGIVKAHAKINLSEIPARPLFRGAKQLPWYWARQEDSTTWVFLAHPKARELKYPMIYGQSHSDKAEVLRVEVDANGYKPVKLVFKPYRSLLLKIKGDSISLQHLRYTPPPATALERPEKLSMEDCY